MDVVETMVRAAHDADALKSVLAAVGSLPGSRGRVYGAAELIELVDLALQAPALARHVTRSCGLRAKVRELAGASTPADDPDDTALAAAALA
ncbi:MAG TPA: hypothetical protein VIS07_01855 [Candidatus Binatia bacterium]